MNIQFNRAGTWQEVSKQEFLELVNAGVIRPETEVIVNDTKAVAAKIKGIVFPSKVAVPPVQSTPEPSPSFVPVPETSAAVPPEAEHPFNSFESYSQTFMASTPPVDVHGNPLDVQRSVDPRDGMGAAQQNSSFYRGESTYHASRYGTGNYSSPPVGFTYFLTPQLITAIWVVYLALTIIGVAIAAFICFAKENTMFLYFPIVCGSLLGLVLVRIFLEFLVVVFSIESHLRAMREQQNKPPQ